jgi:hypothetical protein
MTLITSGEVYKVTSSSLNSFLQPPATSSLLGRNILLSTLFSVYSSLNVRNDVSYPYKTTGRITVLCNLIFKFLYKEREDKGILTGR